MENGLSWNRVIEREKDIFEHIIATDIDTKRFDIKMTVPFYEEFKALITELKYRYEENFVEFLIADIGIARFHYSCRNSGLLDTLMSRKLIIDRFGSDSLEKLRQRMTNSIFTNSKKSKHIYTISLTKRHYIRLEKILEDIEITKEECMLIFCIFIFNMAKEESSLFKRKISKKFKMYYGDKGYVKLIEDGVRRTSYDIIIWISECIPIMVQDIKDMAHMIKGYECAEYDEDKFGIEDLKIELGLKIEAMDCAIETVQRSDIKLSNSLRWEIRDYKEKRKMFCRYCIMSEQTEETDEKSIVDL